MNLFGLLFIFETKHFVVDFLFQNEYHLGKFRKEGWELPLADHCAHHGIATLAIALLVHHSMWWVCLVDFGIHFIMDRIKASPQLLGRFKPVTGEQYMEFKTIIANCTRMGIPSSPEAVAAQCRLADNKKFWWSLGLDQWVHQLTTLLIVWFLVS